MREMSGAGRGEERMREMSGAACQADTRGSESKIDRKKEKVKNPEEKINKVKQKAEHQSCSTPAIVLISKNHERKVMRSGE
ncbi:hypothetical protein STEG23_001233, partial [Scotinomys teguina]